MGIMDDITEEVLKIVNKLDPKKDYNITFQRKGQILNMRIEERPGGNLPADGPTIPKDRLPLDIADIVTYLEMARSAMRDMDFVIRNDLDISDEEFDRLEKQLQEYLEEQ